MSWNSDIEWTDHTLNAWIGCSKTSPGCDNCYAKADFEDRKHRVVWGPGQPRSLTKTWGDPVRWNKQSYFECKECGRRGTLRELDATEPDKCNCREHLIPTRQRVFCLSLGDVFDNEVPPEWRDRLFAVIRATPNLDYQLLTKRVGNVSQMVAAAGGWPQNASLGITVVNQREADRDIPKAIAVKAKLEIPRLFLSLEPLLSAVNIRRWLGVSASTAMQVGGAHEGLRRASPEVPSAGIDLVIVGGESGKLARAMHPYWAQDLRDQCTASGTPFMFKQWGEWKHMPERAHFKEAFSQPWQRLESGIAGIRPALMFRIGKKNAGRLLDGRQWNGVAQPTCYAR